MAITKEEFEKWLHSDDYKPLTYQERSIYITYLKVPRDEHFDYLYCQKNYRGTALERDCSFEYSGIHCKQDGLIYDANGGICRISPLLEYPKSKSVMESELNEAVRAIVEDAVKNDRGNLTIARLADYEKENNLLYYEQYIVPKEARKMFLSGAAPEGISFHCEYEKYNWTEDELLDYISNHEQCEKEEAADYMQTHQEAMLLQFLKNDILKKELSAIENDPQNRLHRIKAIMDAVGSVPEAKTVTVRIDTPSAAFSFKTAASELRRDPGEHYGTWNIAASDRREFEHLFGRGFSYSPDDIIRIDYGKKTLYRADPEYLQAQETDSDITEVDDSEDSTEDESEGFEMTM